MKSFLKKYFLPLFLKLRGLLYKGNAHHCPVCKGSFRTWLPLGYDRRLGQCPGCRSNERDRTLWLFLDRHPAFLKQGRRILHVAPEAHIYNRLRQTPGIKYQPADKFIEGYENTYPADTMYIDITAMPQVADNSYDLILCSHVLECLEDDKAAMSELRRVLVPGGSAILQVPIAFDRAETYEDWSITDPLERERIFGNKWNMRWYGMDYASKLEAAGFQTDFQAVSSLFSKEEVIKFGLGSKDDIHLVHKL